MKGKFQNFLFLGILVITLFSSSIYGYSEEVRYDGMIFDVERNEKGALEATLVAGKKGYVFIPNTVPSEEAEREAPVVKIGTKAFSPLEDLYLVSIPNTVTEIAAGAFKDCINLATATLPKSLKKIGSDAFMATKIVSIIIPDSVRTISDGAFCWCRQLESVVLPKFVTSIEEQAFRDCSKLSSINFGNSLQEIGPSAFYYCKSLISVNFPKSLTEIAGSAFTHCTELKSITFDNSPACISGFDNCTKLTTVNLGNAIKKINAAAFVGCESLVEINLPSSVEEIGKGAFAGCPNLSQVTCLASNPPSANFYTFGENTYTSATLQVPEEYITAYQNMEPWSRFFKIKGLADMEDIEGNAIKVWTDRGFLRVEGAEFPCEVYDMQGRLVTKTSESSIYGLSHGIYLVKIGSETVKISL